MRIDTILDVRDCRGRQKKMYQSCHVMFNITRDRERWLKMC